MALPSVALPGTILGPASKYAPGPGTHIHEAHVVASIAGPVVSSSAPATKSASSTPASKLPLLTISHPTSNTTGIPTHTATAPTVLPEINSTVLARVIRLGPRFASIDILVVDQTVCREPFQGMIRREDIRATEKDKVTVQDSFRVGDLVRGTVISLGDQSNYYVSTAQNEFGVVMATSEEGNVMVPVSWREVRDLRTGKSESRKVAKPL